MAAFAFALSILPCVAVSLHLVLLQYVFCSTQKIVNVVVVVIDIAAFVAVLPEVKNMAVVVVLLFVRHFNTETDDFLEFRFFFSFSTIFPLSVNIYKYFETIPN